MYAPSIAEILGVFGFILSLSVLIVNFARLNFTQTYDFVERESVQAKKDRIQEKLFEELKESLEKTQKDIENMDNDEFQNEMWRFGQEASTCTFPDKMLSQIQFNYAKMTKKLGYIIISTLLLLISIILYFYIITLPEFAHIAIMIYAFIFSVYGYVRNRDLYKMWRNTLRLRIQFNKLSEDINLERMKSIETKLKEEDMFT